MRGFTRTGMLAIIGFVSAGLALCNESKSVGVKHEYQKDKNTHTQKALVECKVSPTIIDSNVIVDVNFTNCSDEDINVEKFRLLMEEELWGPPFTVLRNNKPLQYFGAVVRRGPSGPEDFYMIKSGDSVTVRVILNQYYNCSFPGDYTIWYDKPWFIKDPNNPNIIKKHFEVISNKAKFKVSRKDNIKFTGGISAVDLESEKELELYAKKISVKCEIVPSIVGSEVFVDVNFVNCFDKKMNVEKRQMLLSEELQRDAFKVFCGRKPVPYKGKIVKYGEWKSEDYYDFKSGESIKVRVPLSKYYDCSIPGNYTVWYENKWSVMVDSEDPSAIVHLGFDVISNKAKFKISRKD